MGRGRARAIERREARGEGDCLRVAATIDRSTIDRRPSTRVAATDGDGARDRSSL